MTDGYPYLVKSTWSLPRNLRERHAIRTLDPAQPRVSIYCREESHEDAPWFVASFVRVMHDGQPRWVWSTEYPTADGYTFWIGDRSVGNLVGDKPADLSDSTALSDSAFRVRYALECQICGLRLERRADELNPVLETLWAANHLELSLRGLMSLLR